MPGTWGSSSNKTTTSLLGNLKGLQNLSEPHYAALWNEAFLSQHFLRANWVPGSVLIQQPCEVNAINNPILQLWKQTLSGVKSFTQGHTTSERQRWDSATHISPPEAVFLTTPDILAINSLQGSLCSVRCITGTFFKQRSRKNPVPTT